MAILRRPEDDYYLTWSRKPRSLALAQNYFNMVQLDGGTIINFDRVLREFRRPLLQQSNGLIVAPWAGVKLRQDGGQTFVEKAYSMRPYSEGTYYHPEQLVPASQPEQVGEEWVFDGVDDYLTVDVMDRPLSFSTFSHSMMSGNTTIICGQIEGGVTSSNRRFGLFSTSQWLFVVSTGTDSPQVHSGLDGTRKVIGVYDDSSSTGDIYIDGQHEGTNTISINTGGTTFFGIGAASNGGLFHDEPIIGATGLILSVLDQQQITELNALM